MEESGVANDNANQSAAIVLFGIMRCDYNRAGYGVGWVVVLVQTQSNLSGMNLSFPPSTSSPYHKWTLGGDGKGVLLSPHACYASYLVQVQVG